MATKGSGAPTVLGTVAAAVATAGANELVTIVRAHVQNIGAAARLVTVYQVPSGGAVSDTTNKAHTQTIYTGQSGSLDISGMMVAAGSSLWMKADVASEVILSLNLFRSDQQP